MYMTWFAVIVAGSFFIAMIARSFPMRRPNGLRLDPIPNPIGFLIPAAAFGVFSGLRSTIGDTESYIYSYSLLDPDTMEPVPFRMVGGMFYGWLQYRLRLTHDDPYLLIMIMSLIAIIPAVLILYRYCTPYEMGVAFFVLTGYYSFSMNGMRQYAAAGVILLGTKYLLGDHWTDAVKFAPFILGAWLIHSSAWIMIPIFFVARRRAWTPLTILLVLGTAVVTFSFDAILPGFLDALENTDYNRYVENGWFTSSTETGSSIIRVFVLIVPLVLAYMSRFKLRMIYGRRWDTLVNLSILNLVFYMLSLYNWIFARLAIYTSIYVIVMMTHVLLRGIDEQNSRSYNMIALLLYIFYFYNIRYSIEEYKSEQF